MCRLTLHRNMHTKFGMIWTNCDKVIPPGQGNPDDDNAAAATAAESNPYMSPIQATQQLEIKLGIHVTVHRNMHTKFGMIWTNCDKVIPPGQGNPDDDNAAAATAAESNPYMSPIQATQQLEIKLGIHVTVT